MFKWKGRKVERYNNVRICLFRLELKFWFNKYREYVLVGENLLKDFYVSKIFKFEEIK